MTARRTTAGGPRPNVAHASADEGHELAPQARVAVAGPVVTAVEHRREGNGIDLARQAEQRGPVTEPAAGSLALEVVVLHAASDGVEVVALLALGQLPDAQHGRTAVTSGAAAPTRACGASS